MRRCAVGCLLPWFVFVLIVVGCRERKAATTHKETALAERIERLVETILTSENETQKASALSDTLAIFESEDIPSVAKVGDAAACPLRRPDAITPKSRIAQNAHALPS